MSPDKSIRIPKKILDELFEQNPERCAILIASGTIDDTGHLVTKFQHLNEYHIAPPRLNEFGAYVDDEPLLTFSL